MLMNSVTNSMYGDMEVQMCTLLIIYAYVLKLKIHFAWNLLNNN